MITTEERTNTIDYIVAKITTTKNIVSDMGTIKRYKLDLPYCSLGILMLSHQDGLSIEPIVEIVEHFGDSNFQAIMEGDMKFDGVRTKYKGGMDGLDEVSLQGIYIPNAKGESVLPAESLQRSKDFTDVRGLTLSDVERFDRWLQYARREL